MITALTDSFSLLLITGMAGVLVALAPFAFAEWIAKRREQRQLDEAVDMLMRIGFLENLENERRKGE